MKVVISIFCLPYEIDDLENTLNQLKRASYYIDKKIDWCLDITMCTANDMINWKKSSIPKEFFNEKLLKLSSSVDWCTKNIQTSEKIKGCVSQRRYSLEKHREADYFIWLDTDIIFDERTLSYIEQAIKGTNEQFHNCIITPEIVRVWDNTWDCLVNENFLDKPLDYQKTNDPYQDSGIKGDITIVGVNNSHSPQSRFKFAGGWFTCISGKLLNRIGVPKSFGHYGLEDTFVMMASEILVKEKGEQINQFKIKNLVVCENYKYRGHSHYLNNISAYDRREEFRNIAHSNFMTELKNIV